MAHYCHITYPRTLSILTIPCLMLWCIVYFSTTALAQQPIQYLDSLHHIVQHNEQHGKIDTTTIVILRRLVAEYRGIDLDRARVFALKAKEYAERLNEPHNLSASLAALGAVLSDQGHYSEAIEPTLRALNIAEQYQHQSDIAGAYNTLGIIYKNMGDYAGATEYHKKAIELHQKTANYKDLAYSYDDFGNLYRAQGNYSLALEYYLKALSLHESLSDKLGISIAVNYIGMVYQTQKKYNQALESFYKVLALSKELSNKRQIARSYTNIAAIFSSKEDYTTALQYYSQALELQQEVGGIRRMAALQNSIGEVYRKNQQHSKALERHTKALQMLQLAGDKESMAQTHNHIGNVYILQHLYSEAGKSLNKALELSASIGARRIQQQSLELLAMLYSAQSDYKSAMTFYTQSVKIKDSLMTSENLRHTAQLQTQYESDRKDKEITLLKSKEREQLLFQQILLVGSSFSLIILVIVIFAYRTKKRSERILTKTNRELQFQKNTVEQQSLLLQKVNEEVQLQNEEISRKNTILDEQSHFLQKTNSQLDEANHALLTQNEQLIQLNNEKNELLGVVSHDLKNPVGAIQGMADLLRENQTSFSHQEQQKLLEEISKAAQKVFTLIHNLLHINAIESGKMPCSLVHLNLQPIAKAVVESYHHRAEAKNIRIHFHSAELMAVIVDEIMIQQCLDNLLSNAIKYSPRGSNVWVTLEHMPAGSSLHHTPAAPVQTNNAGSRLRCAIRDQGPGFTYQDQQLLFQKFVKLSARPTGGEDSSGLGLFIVKKMVEQMNGVIWCESVYGQGATFYLEFTAVPDKESHNIFHN